MAETVPFGGRDYFILLGLLVFGRGMDLLSTRVATPNLVLEGNPLARWMGWKWGGLVNAAMCVVFAVLPVPAIVIGTASVLFAAHNFQGAWLMRTMGEEHYRTWFVSRLQKASPPFYLFCLFAQTALIVLVGGAVIYFSPRNAAVAQAIGASLVFYAAAVAIYTLFAFWRIRRAAV